ncbi:MAG: hypothetical protein IT431_11645 [Phycisphaerales bacterium]|nr:hypothetical protein [Phycisphaerales bacterium]
MSWIEPKLPNTSTGRMYATRHRTLGWWALKLAELQAHVESAGGNSLVRRIAQDLEIDPRLLRRSLDGDLANMPTARLIALAEALNLSVDRCLLERSAAALRTDSSALQAISNRLSYRLIQRVGEEAQRVLDSAEPLLGATIPIDILAQILRHSETTRVLTPRLDFGIRFKPGLSSPRQGPLFHEIVQNATKGSSKLVQYLVAPNDQPDGPDHLRAVARYKAEAGRYLEHFLSLGDVPEDKLLAGMELWLVDRSDVFLPAGVVLFEICDSVSFRSNLPALWEKLDEYGFVATDEHAFVRGQERGEPFAHGQVDGRAWIACVRGESLKFAGGALIDREFIRPVVQAFEACHRQPLTTLVGHLPTPEIQIVVRRDEVARS